MFRHLGTAHGPFPTGVGPSSVIQTGFEAPVWMPPSPEGKTLGAAERMQGGTNAHSSAMDSCGIASRWMEAKEASIHSAFCFLHSAFLMGDLPDGGTGPEKWLRH